MIPKPAYRILIGYFTKEMKKTPMGFLSIFCQNRTFDEVDLFILFFGLTGRNRNVEKKISYKNIITILICQDLVNYLMCDLLSGYFFYSEWNCKSIGKFENC